jgi:hypothetical protein
MHRFNYLSLVRKLAFLFLLFAAGPAYPSDEVDSEGVILFPHGDLYPHYAADPHRVGFGVQRLSFTNVQIPSSGDNRVAIRAGGRLGIVRIHPAGNEERGWQAGLEGGFNAQFDADHSLDNIGWDGRYGLVITTAQSRQWAFKFGLLHDSSHVGDDYLERTGRKRIGYTRHELAAGASWFPDKRLLMYGEAGWGYELSNTQLQEPGRIQFGLAYEPFPALEKDRMGWYGAADLSAMEERSWRVDRSLQTGVVARSDGRTWRFGIEWYRGRPPIGEFFQATEEYVSVGLWIDI